MATAWDPEGSNESIFTRRRQRRKRNSATFVYDVGVNVVANIVTVIGGLLLGQAAGLFDFQPIAIRRLQGAALLILTGVIFWLLFLWVSARWTELGMSAAVRNTVLSVLLAAFVSVQTLVGIHFSLSGWVESLSTVVVLVTLLAILVWRGPKG